MEEGDFQEGRKGRMTIKKLNTHRRRKISIDLTGPEGNAYYLLGLASKLSKQLGKDPSDILNKMRSSDYENLLKVFDDEFGSVVDLYR
jgi:hypothetical protein